MEETNRSSHSDTKKLNHFLICYIIIPTTNGNKRRNLMQNKILYYQSLPSVTYIEILKLFIFTLILWN